jgi:hypothetical protein
MLSKLKYFTKLERAMLIFIWVVIIALFAYAGLSTYFYTFYQKPSVTWSTKTFPLVSTTLKQGEPIQAIVTRCSAANYLARTKREVIDSIAYSIPESTVTFVKGCVQEIRYVPEVTKVLPLGTYYLRNHIEVDVRWLFFNRVDKFETQTVQFTIIE